jgi:molecular chaperone HtpG
MEGARDELLNVSQVRDYLSMVAPVPFANIFTLKNKIYEKAKEKNITIDEYNVYVNTDQIYKGYKNYIYNNNAVSEEDTIIDVNFIEDYYNNDLLFWGWYGISKVMHQIPDENKERGIRLRKSNIQIGLENCLDEYHKEFQGNRYFIGEVYAINRELIPNARRDFFIENDECSQFSQKLREIFHNLYKFYYDFSKKNSAINTLQELEVLNQKLENKTIDNTTKEELKSKIEKGEKKAITAKKTLTTLKNKYNGQVLGNIIKDIELDITQEEPARVRQLSSTVKQEIATKKTLTQQEETILKKVYNVLRQNLSKATAEELILKFEEEFRQ